MDYWDYRQAAISSIEKSANLYLTTKEINREYYDAVSRWIDSEGQYLIAAMLLNDLPKGDIKDALINFMFSERHIEDECERIEAVQAEKRAESDRYDEIGY
jgi:hypothetical protein